MEEAFRILNCIERAVDFLMLVYACSCKVAAKGPEEKQEETEEHLSLEWVRGFLWLLFFVTARGDRKKSP